MFICDSVQTKTRLDCNYRSRKREREQAGGCRLEHLHLAFTLAQLLNSTFNLPERLPVLKAAVYR